ncbi:NAD(P)/FAD-dependent oxidoreductase [Streptomyces mobaraensis]|uniref:FAD-binding oxidoreductase n=1 Tax=Streptomyces mobaraensis TaxID=35621 RepID=A0A5N5VWR8_STRMB|nr:FAD-dependent oxidoreductase [Streptomyces mobaraensis]KAB7832663.1 FAD-binding oxidoreductase [Streptomyces mobaraensis]
MTTPVTATGGRATPDATADVAVVGAGVIGLATAERLTARGHSVIVIDDRGVAGGVTGASGGLVRALDPASAGVDAPSAASEWAAEGLGRYLRRGGHGRWPAVREHGSLTLFAADAAGRAAAGAERVRAAGFPAEVLDAREIAAAFPGLAPPEGMIGVHEPRAGWLPARAVAEAMLRDADTVTVLRARALEITTARARVTGVRTTDGFVAAGAVLLAAGVGSTALARTVGVELPLRTRSVSFCVFAPRVPVPGVLPAVLDTTTGGWLRRWDDGSAVLAGVPSRECDVPPVITQGVPDTEAKRVREVARYRCPALGDADVVGGVTAFDALAPEGEGVTVWPEPRGLVTAVGWNGGGFKKAPAAGRYAADRIGEVIA